VRNAIRPGFSPAESRVVAHRLAAAAGRAEARPLRRTGAESLGPPWDRDWKPGPSVRPGLKPRPYMRWWTGPAILAGSM